MRHPITHNTAEDFSDSDVSDKDSKKRPFVKVERSEDAPDSKRACVPAVLSLPCPTTSPQIVSVIEMKRTHFYDHHPLCGVALKVDGDKTFINLVIPIDVIGDEDMSIFIFTSAETKLVDSRLLRQGGGTEMAGGRPARNVLWQGGYPSLSHRQVFVAAGDYWFKVNLTHGDPVMCLKPFNDTPTLCFNNECQFPHSSYIRVTGEMRLLNIPHQMEAWTFPETASRSSHDNEAITL